MVDGKDPQIPGSAPEPGNAPQFDNHFIVMTELTKSPIAIGVLGVAALLCLLHALSLVSLVAGYIFPILYTFVCLRDDHGIHQSFWLKYWLISYWWL